MRPTLAVGSCLALFSYQAQAQSGPHSIAYADKFRDVSRCVLSCFAGTATYSTPAYVSLDQARSVTLVYRSDRAFPMVTVAFDANDPNPGNVVTYSLKLRRDDGTFVTFAGGRQEIYYAKATSGPTRLVAQVHEGSTVSTGAYGYIAVIRPTTAAVRPRRPRSRRA